MTNREKLLSDITLKDFQEILCNHSSCLNCPLNTVDICDCRSPYAYEPVLNEWLDKEAEV